MEQIVSQLTPKGPLFRVKAAPLQNRLVVVMKSEWETIKQRTLCLVMSSWRSPLSFFRRSSFSFTFHLHMTPLYSALPSIQNQSTLVESSSFCLAKMQNCTSAESRLKIIIEDWEVASVTTATTDRIRQKKQFAAQSNLRPSLSLTMQKSRVLVKWRTRQLALPRPLIMNFWMLAHVLQFSTTTNAFIVGYFPAY